MLPSSGSLGTPLEALLGYFGGLVCDFLGATQGSGVCWRPLGGPEALSEVSRGLQHTPDP
eukprot:9231549-Pyramimonas_sp.AAC.1